MGPLQSKQCTTAPCVDSPASNQDVPSAADGHHLDGPATALTLAAIRDEDVPPLSESKEKNSDEQLKPRSSWYLTWPRKSMEFKQVAREANAANKSSTASSLRSLGGVDGLPVLQTSVPRPPSMCLGKGKGTLDITIGGIVETMEVIGNRTPSIPAVEPGSEIGDSGKAATSNLEEASAMNKPQMAPDTSITKAPLNWLGGWIGLSDKPEADCSRSLAIESEAAGHLVGESMSTTEQAPDSQTRKNVDPTGTIDRNGTPWSWFGRWSTALPPISLSNEDEVAVMAVNTDQAMATRTITPTKLSSGNVQPTPGSSWAFWSTESTRKDGVDRTEEVGQLAVAGDSSQDRPELAEVTLPKNSKIPKRARAKSTLTEVVSRDELHDGGPPRTETQYAATIKAPPHNILLPSVMSTYRPHENPSILQQISRLLSRGTQRPLKHVSLSKNAPRIRKALAIGIHGLFPAPLIRTVLGQPTGTSLRFANHAAASIRQWADKNGSNDCEIEICCLEGEGKIAERVDNLWKLLLNWIDQVRSADFILLACHSQGVPVAIMLTAKLIELGVVSTGRIGVCAMAGVSLGPFADYKSRLFSGSAGELFEFADPNSVVSKKYEDALRVALKYGVRITYCGSIDDQLVSMESSTFAIASHPYIYRAVFVDGRLHAPDFLTHLVGFALKLRNLGVPDHGLIRELSAPLAGSLYTGEGHSRLYDDSNVYGLAIEFALQTTCVGNVPLDLKKYEIQSTVNPYILPWIMRGLLEEEFVKTELSHEATQLLKQFDDWKPSTKVLKDVKYRLEAVRSKL